MDHQQVGLEGALDRLVPLFIPADDRDAVANAWHAQTSTVITILDPAELSAGGGPRPWFESWDPSQGYYWRRQQSYLRNRRNRADYEIDTLDRSSNRVLAHLEDPHSPTGFNVRGLVMGYVQSGKTANFSALIAKAVDAGYKVVIVLSGLHNTLRQQTQRRLQQELGHDETEGVGAPDAAHTWVWMTGAGLNEDFNPAGQNAGVLQGNNQVILVVKKNKSRLDRLIRWMRGKLPAGVPVLIIDDEADLASVNIGGNRSGWVSPKDATDITDETDLTADDVDGDFSADEVDPSAINARIRTLCGLFRRCSFVAYTATPFANVLIDPDAIDREAGHDLYPRDFIISLPRPPGSRYVGNERLFGRDQLAGDADDVEGLLDVIEIIPEYERMQLIPRRGTDEEPDMPPSLRQALRDYLLGAAAWLYRSGTDVPCTMLVHTDMRKAVQDSIAHQIEVELAVIRQGWKYDDKKELRRELIRRWEVAFRPQCAALNLAWDIPFTEIEPQLDRLITDGVGVLRLNSNWPDELNFDAQPTLKAVIVGGNKLSRGVTIEGLLVSYYVRAAPYYDTHLQMGRWFGYRGDYVDLTRLYSTQVLVTWFHDVATAEEDLRRQIEMYDRLKVTPRDLAPRIRTHPVMMVTAPNKMRDAQEISQSYAGELVQTLRFPFGEPGILDLLDANVDVTRTLLGSLGSPERTEDGKLAWEDADVGVVQSLLGEFRVIPQQSIDPATVREYIREQTTHGELVRWSVVVCCAAREDALLGVENLGVSGLPAIPLINRSRLGKDPTSLGVITSPDDELHGLSPGEISDADERFADHEFPTRGKAYRSKRLPQEGLLLIYPISGNSVPGRNSRNRVALFEPGQGRRTVVGYALSFPFSESDATVTYVQGPGGIRR
jgi:hypothetical protein